MNMIGKKAKDFTAPAVMGDNTINDNFNFHEYIAGSNAVLFFYPLDFTFVCPSEIIALNEKMSDFQARNTKVMTVSVDSQFTHLAYKNTSIANGGIGQVKFPMIADITKSISRDYGVLHDESVSLRGVFIFDKTQTLRHQLVNDLPIGRSIDEILRTVDAIDFHEKHGEVCPANWRKGEDGMQATQEGVASYLKNRYS